MDKVFAYERQKLGRPEDDKMELVDTNAMIWWIFMTASMKAAVLGKDYEETLRVKRNPALYEIRPLFSIKQKLILDQQDEIFGVSTIDWDQTPWMKSTLVHEHATK